MDLTNNVIYKPNPPSEERAVLPLVRLPVSTEYCSCVIYIKSLTGFSGSIDYAKNWPTNSTEPTVGGVVITSESAPGTSTGHVAYIEAIEDGFLILKEANYSKCQLTSGRKLAIDSPLIIGFWIP